jgi:hypothetical protein
MPLDLGDNPAGFAPTGSLVAEVYIVSAHVLWRRADGALKEVGYIALQNGVRRQPDRVAKVLGFKELVNVRKSERRVASEEAL